MSLILEALRRSEAERRLGQAPDLLSPMPSARRPRRPGLRALAITAALLAVGGSAWWLGQRSAGPTTIAPTTAPESGPVAAPATPSAATPPTVVPAPPPASPPASAVPSTAISAPARPAPPSATPSAPISATPSAPGVTTTQAIASPPAPASTPPTPAGPASAEELAELRARLAPAAADLRPVADEPAPAATSDAAIPPLSSLPADLRVGLPPLKLTMHVYNDSPERRFVILDGRRLTEGVAITADLALAEIRRDGVVLDLGGRRVLLPRP